MTTISTTGHGLAIAMYWHNQPEGPLMEVIPSLEIMRFWDVRKTTPCMLWYGYYMAYGWWWLIIIWLVVYLPLWKIWVRQWEGWYIPYEMENNPFMFETCWNHQADNIYTRNATREMMSHRIFTIFFEEASLQYTLRMVSMHSTVHIKFRCVGSSCFPLK